MATPVDEIASAEATLAVLQSVLRGIGGADMSKQTPCSEYDVAQLTDHLMNSITLIGGAAGAESPTPDENASLETRVVGAAQAAIDAWRRRGLQGTVALGPNEAPAKIFTGILSLEFLVHAWDYAVATEHQMVVAEPLCDYVLELASTIITPEGRGDVGFADPIDVPADACPLDRLVAFTGRQPQ